MTDVVSPEEQVAEAGAWLARLSGDEAAEESGPAFDAWLATPGHRAAYQEALALWHEFDARADAVLAELSEPTPVVAPAVAPVIRLADRRRPARHWWVPVGGVAVAAGLALAVMPSVLTQPTVQSFATGKGQHQTVALADGTKLDLDAETRLTVTLSRGERRVALADGQVIFDVAHDEKRPFTVEARGRLVRDLGTQFDVKARGDQLTVTVARGRVEVTSEAAGSSAQGVILTPGERLAIGPEGPAQLTSVDPQETFSWRSGRLVYRGQPLADVVADLNRQFVEQTEIADPELGKLPITGVIVLDNPRAVMARLALMLPIKAVPSDRALTLHRK
jgi:transmembrane sensor